MTFKSLQGNPLKSKFVKVLTMKSDNTQNFSLCVILLTIASYQESPFLGLFSLISILQIYHFPSLFYRRVLSPRSGPMLAGGTPAFLVTYHVYHVLSSVDTFDCVT